MDGSERDELVRKLFALMTAKFEDGAGIAVEGQGGNRLISQQAQFAAQLQSIGEEVSILAGAAAFICSDATS